MNFKNKNYFIKQIEWFKSNVKIDFEKALNLKVKTEEVHRKGVKSILVFRQIAQEDFVNYTCKGVNSYGSTSFNIKLEAKSIGFF